MEDFKAERHDRQLEHGRFVERQKEWENQRDRLTEEIQMLKEQLDAYVGRTEVCIIIIRINIIMHICTQGRLFKIKEI